MKNNKIIAMMMTLSMLAAAFAGCLGGEDEPEPDWYVTVADDVNAVFVTSDWDPIIPNLNDGEMCDALLSAMTKTVEREVVVDFTRGYYTSSQGVIGAAGAAAISSVADLNADGTRVALQSGTTSDLYAAANLGAATIVAYPDFPSVTAAIGNGDADYAIGDAPVLALSGDLLTTFSDETFGIAVAGTDDSDDMRNTELLDALDMAITEIIDSGEYDLIFGAWFEGAVVLTDDRTDETAGSWPVPSEGSSLTTVLESGDLRFCSDTSYPPFENLDADGNAEGFDVDIGNAIADEIAANYMGVSNPMFVPPVVVVEDVTIKIGLLNPITGPISQFAPPFTFAAAQAIADLNAANDGYNFEIVEADSGCDGTVAATAAQSLIDSGVVAVAGAACSGASMGANAVLSAAGVPMVSYASTSPALSDATAYPDFYRVVPSDAIQGDAMADMVAARGVSNPALIHMTNAYGAGLADSFEGFWLDAGNSLCLKTGYDDTTLSDAAALVQAVIDGGCDSVVLASYSADGAMIIETMAGMGAAVPIFGADGIAGEAALGDYSNPAAANGVQVTKPRAAAGAGGFAAICADDAVCSTGIFQSESYDAVMMIGEAATHADGADMATHLDMVGMMYEGASGVHDFLANGDVAGAGYDVCSFNHVPTYGDYFNCNMMWTATDGLSAAPFMGATVKIGFLNDASGPIAVYAAGFVAASQIAVGIANTIGWNSMVQFEIVYADSGCDGTMGAAAAQALVDAGVVGVVGAACSGATMGANAVLAAAGIPQISYASTSPALSDAIAYPDFFRVVPSDALQGQALSAVVKADAPADGSVGLIHMTNAYGSGLADSFSADFTADGTMLCTTIGYEETVTDFTSAVQALVDNGCTSVVLVSYAADGGMILDEMATQSWSGQVYGGDGIAEEGLAAGTSASVDGIIATKPASGTMGTVGYVFANLCAQSPDCAGGIYTAEAFDGVVIMALAAFAQMASPGATLSQVIMGTGQGLEGASGTISFLANGDSPGAGYCVGDFTEDASGNVAFTCNRSWDPANGMS
ncbi:MAG: ABC transporter substrate-binding protein [Euryarchaeota archaeon]|jgi:branched-chain amino acid transport system substrate-binding protein|nr:ABC transporter substrate-binding protein [Euryarchaeota archaeon]MBT3653982.1 ABC transporter substrate-binding protein [Euryarchaeota archaeon]MBT3758174.1 ABC transporter substrate-binding protein [Euryarchaeota archaeon]MBT4051228.1 ABC transporter substrate-binding protein [Euryarchaeota archaeon]MBT4346053.1 ABC transporter substrate-binding protein [Euryarchaeota archaeon]